MNDVENDSPVVNDSAFHIGDGIGILDRTGNTDSINILNSIMTQMKLHKTEGNE